MSFPRGSEEKTPVASTLLHGGSQLEIFDTEACRTGLRRTAGFLFLSQPMSAEPSDILRDGLFYQEALVEPRGEGCYLEQKTAL